MPLDNVALAELLALEAEKEKDHVAKAFRRASIAALTWQGEAAEMVRQGRSLQELAGIGPFLKRRIEEWLENPPEAPEPSPLRRDYYSVPRARRIIETLGPLKVRGDLQMHSEWSDGSATIAAMAEAAFKLGHEYISITDHTKGLKIAGGIDEQQLAEQWNEIEQVNKAYKGKFRVFRSAELNISPAGELDLEPDCLDNLDIVLGSFHSALRKKEDQTNRYLAALRNPAIHILGHPKGRVYNYRAGLEADWDKVFAVAAELDKAVEVDCYVDRQDLPLWLLRKAKKAKVRISLGTDAHNPIQLKFLEYGIAAVLEAGIPEERIINSMSAEQLLGWVQKLKAKAGRNRIAIGPGTGIFGKS